MTINTLSLDQLPDLTLTGAELRLAVENSRHLATELAGHYRWADSNAPGPYVVSAEQSSAERAFLAELLRSHSDAFHQMEGPLGEQEAQVRVLRDEEGTLSYIVELGQDDNGTHCSVEDLPTLNDWFDEDWIEDAQ